LVDLKTYLKDDKSLYQFNNFSPIWINDSFEEKTEKLRNLIYTLGEKLPP